MDYPWRALWMLAFLDSTTIHAFAGNPPKISGTRIPVGHPHAVQRAEVCYYLLPSYAGRVGKTGTVRIWTPDGRVVRDRATTLRPRPRTTDTVVLL